MTENNENIKNELTPSEDGKTKKSYYKTDDEYLLYVKVALNNSNQKDIEPILSAYGYPQKRIDEGKALYSIAVEKQKDQVKEYGEQYTATENLIKAMDEVREEYLEHIKIANVAFRKQRGVLAEIAASGERKKTQAGWIAQANTFYKNLLAKSEYLAAMANYGQTEDKLTTTAAKFKTISDLYDKRQKEAGEAQTATTERDEAIDVLDEWFTDYADIAVIALSKKPELLEILGL